MCAAADSSQCRCHPRAPPHLLAQKQFKRLACRLLYALRFEPYLVDVCHLKRRSRCESTDMFAARFSATEVGRRDHTDGQLSHGSSLYHYTPHLSSRIIVVIMSHLYLRFCDCKPAGVDPEARKWSPPSQLLASLPCLHRNPAALCAILSRSVHLSPQFLVRGRP